MTNEEQLDIFRDQQLAEEQKKEGDSDRPVGIQDFDIKRVIGRGAFGKVFLCVKKSDPNRPLAMKAIRKDKIIEEGIIDAVKSEEQILKLCEGHPFLVATEYKFETKERIFFVMPFFRAGELFTHL